MLEPEDVVLDMPGGLTEVDMDLESSGAGHSASDPLRCSASQCVKGGVPIGAPFTPASPGQGPPPSYLRRPFLQKSNGDLSQQVSLIPLLASFSAGAPHV